ncbi:hypothetical protein RSAG8_08653, partial [Rhizoctonia solani AG-8 WAC10335]
MSVLTHSVSSETAAHPALAFHIAIPVGARPAHPSISKMAIILQALQTHCPFLAIDYKALKDDCNTILERYNWL